MHTHHGGEAASISASTSDTHKKCCGGTRPSCKGCVRCHSMHIHQDGDMSAAQPADTQA